ncbi:transcriptional regulator [Peribacillus simplex]|uniref:hypothetical protein n=1 Tax=Peribacillus simplex TaxID=1478 RepID=UPI002989AE50|nr:hypothetical protein [Peribacillus simplex]MBX9955099.1 transcriptional regulator [Peribacillus simplex]
MEELVSLRHAARLIGVNYTTILHWREKGKITYHEPKQGGIELSEVLRIKKERGDRK